MVVVVAAGSSHPAAGQVGRAGTLELVSQSATVEPDGVFRADVRVSGVGAETSIAVSLHERVTSRSIFQIGVDLEVGGSTLVEYSTIELTDVAPAGSVGLAIDTADHVELLTEPGVYPVTIVLLGSAGAELDRLLTHLVLLPDTDEPQLPLTVAMILPFGADPSIGPCSEMSSTRWGTRLMNRVEVSVRMACRSNYPSYEIS